MTETMSIEATFKNIWKDGAVFSSRERCRKGISSKKSCLFTRDTIAGDDKYVFMTLCKPHSIGKAGYYLAFDAEDLARRGAIVGIDDMDSVYYATIHAVDPNIDRYGIKEIPPWSEDTMKEYLEKIEFAQEIFRLHGKRAIEYLKWIRGIRKDNPITEAEVRWVDRELNILHYLYTSGTLVNSRSSAVNSAEILVEKALPLDRLIGVIFRRKWYTIRDFSDAYGVIGKESNVALGPHDAPRGYPHRCPRCRGLVWRSALASSRDESWSPVHRDRVKAAWMKYPVYVIVCQSCSAVFNSSHGNNPLQNEDAYLGQIEDFESVR
jgi:hypothetical protein